MYHALLPPIPINIQTTRYQRVTPSPPFSTDNLHSTVACSNVYHAPRRAFVIPVFHRCPLAAQRTQILSNRRLSNKSADKRTHCAHNHRQTVDKSTSGDRQNRQGSRCFSDARRGTPPAAFTPSPEHAVCKTSGGRPGRGSDDHRSPTRSLNSQRAMKDRPAPRHARRADTILRSWTAPQ